jgi:hypothetical protein
MPSALQMGWVESPAYFCTASETARDVATRYIESPLSSMNDHKFIEHAMHSTDTAQLLAETTTNELKYFVEVYMDDFIHWL